VKYRIVSDKKLNRKNTRTRAHLNAIDRMGSSRELQHHFPTKGVQQHGISTDFGRELKRRCVSGHAVFLRRGRPQARPTALSVRPTPNDFPFPTTSSMWSPVLTVYTSIGGSLLNKRQNAKGGGDVGVTWSMQ
jgi:hypothetical protein